MNEIIRIKQSPAVQLAHLYEHIYCAQLEKMLNDRGIFPYLDYELVGHTYQPGIVYVSIQLLTSKAQKIADSITNLETDFSDAAISIAASQIMAEKQYGYVSEGMDVVRRSLQSLDELPWQDLDTLRTLDLQGVRRKSKPYYLDTTNKLPATTLHVDVTLDTDFQRKSLALTPLFKQVALVVSDYLQSNIADTCGYYSIEGHYTQNKTFAKYSCPFLVPNGHDADLAEISRTTQTAVATLRQKGAFDRLADELGSISYRHRPTLAPDPRQTFIDSGIFVGAKGWQELATPENIEAILAHTYLTVRYKKLSMKSDRASTFRS